MLKHVCIGSLALAAASAAGAKDAPMAASAAAMPAEMSQYDYFLGTWHCSGKAFANPDSPEHATTATVHAGKAVGNRWVHVTYDENKTAANAMPYHAGILWGYDSGRKVFVQSCFDNMGGYCHSTSPGWNGDALVFEGDSNGMGPAAMVRDTFTKKSATELMHTGEMQGADKKWVKTDEETCHKAK